MSGRGVTDGSASRGLGLRVKALSAVFAVVALGSTWAAEPGSAPLEVVEAFDIRAVEAHTGALLLSGQAGGDVEGALTWTVVERSDEGVATVPFVVEVDGTSLLSSGVGRDIAIGLYAYVVDDDGRVVDHIAQGVILDPTTSADRIRAAGLKFVGYFTLPPGRYALRVMVRNQRSAAFFMSWSLLELPSGDDVGPQLLPPVFPDPGAGWLVTRQAGVDATVTLGPGAVLLPSARPTLREDEPTEIWLGGGGWDPGARVGVRILNALGRTVSEPVAQMADSAVGRFAFRRGSLTPVDLPPGDYTLIVTLTDDQTSEVLRRALPIVVVGQGGAAVWAARESEEAGAAAPVERSAAPLPKISKKEMRTTYRQAMAALGDGDSVAARRTLAELERSVLADFSAKALKDLGEAEYAESKELAKSDPYALMPMALLHRELYRSYNARGEGTLAIHARRITISFAQQLARLKPGNGFSEGLMVNLAADLAQMGASSAARELLEQALLVSPGYREAMLALGFSYERNGVYLEATTAYRRLVDAHPSFDEGRLRLAINLVRTGRDSDGLELLEGLVESDARPWVQAVAAHEMVRYQVENGRFEDAERLVRRALEFNPNDQRLWVLLAATLEQTNRHDEEMSIIGALPPPSRGVTPRARYAEWPAVGVRASQATLTARAAEAMPALRAALGPGGRE